MKKHLFFTTLFCLPVALSFGQAMTSTMTGTASDSDTSAPTNSMMAPATTQPGTAMMSVDQSYESLKARGRLADSKTGASLRIAKGSGGKVLFSDLADAKALAAKGPTLLFFAADWCPSCQADLRDINANGKRLSGATVVVVDYDKAADLKARYAVTVQDTFVLIDKTGAKLSAWNGGGVDGILDHLKSM